MTDKTGVGGHNMVGRISRVIIKRPEEAFVDQPTLDRDADRYGFTEPPNFTQAADEHRGLVALLESIGADVLQLPADGRVGIDSIYTHDPVLVTNAGIVLLRPGKPVRINEPQAMGDSLKDWGVPILGTIVTPGTVEGGDLTWLDDNTLLAGRSHRTNPTGLEQLRRLLVPLDVEVVEFGLPWWQGEDDLVHLMSVISMLDHDLAIVHRRLMPITLVDLLEARGVELIDGPDDEYETLGCNVLALAPREVVLVAGNPNTAKLLSAAGCAVHEIPGEHMGRRGSGGPTCLTRPILRASR